MHAPDESSETDVVELGAATDLTRAGPVGVFDGEDDPILRFDWAG